MSKAVDAHMLGMPGPTLFEPNATQLNLDRVNFVVQYLIESHS